MFRHRLCRLGRCQCFPRIRGDVPHEYTRFGIERTFSPHTRGCSASIEDRRQAKKVFPAYAGMFLLPARAPNHLPSFPRIRGDVPNFIKPAWDALGFSPHTRGCSFLPVHHVGGVPVFPAYAGMFRYTVGVGSGPTCFPRIRGDVPK